MTYNMSDHIRDRQHKYHVTAHVTNPRTDHVTDHVMLLDTLLPSHLLSCGFSSVCHGVKR